ncbi:diacylglycerol kinase theta-like [Cucumis melo var. makuwa]|uniref:Diacylglycerol kinase theta-like n=2 Tax=Cucumis melo TaxID=3656 RepID=A0A5A7TP67_CUCMM|nr:diacylglycerol kinase theta-like [Cucumis melo var. makuwa]TYK23576.1 diacylglycerol kinase theta-like [Cucumis melo var. makuwa]
MNLSNDDHYSHRLSSFLHHHPLTHNMIHNPHHPSRTHLICDVCRETIHSSFYQCKDCHFYVHSFCTRLPNSLRHVKDPDHKLRLYKPSYGHCSICKVNIHLNCLRTSRACPTSCSRGIHHHAPPPWSMGPPSQPDHFHGWGYPDYNSHVQFGYNNNNNHQHHQMNHGNTSSTLGSVLGSTMLSLVALNDFIFG